MKKLLTNKRGLAAALVATAALAMTAATTLGAFTASITNKTNTFAAGTLVLKESNASASCYSTGTGSGGTVTTNTQTCSINLFGGATKQVPGGAATTTTVTFTNVGNTQATPVTLTSSTCTVTRTTATSAGYYGSDATFCGKVTVQAQVTGTTSKCLYPASTTAACGTTFGSLASFSSKTYALKALAPNSGSSDVVVIKVKLSSTATNADMGLKAIEKIVAAA